MTALACDVSVGYRGVTVARDIALEVDSGRIIALLGPNGAGKTTLLLTLAGFLPPISGEITIGGTPVRTGSARRLNRSGVVLIPDRRALFTQLSVIQNLRVAKANCKRPGPSIDETLDLFPSLRLRTNLKSGMLSGGEQQMLALARALVQAPMTLLIDEMSMGLAPAIVEAMMPLLRTVADERQVGIVMVEQHVRLALEVADDAVVLAHGEVVLRDRAEALRDDVERLEAAYLGATDARTA